MPKNNKYFDWYKRQIDVAVIPDRILIGQINAMCNIHAIDWTERKALLDYLDSKRKEN